MLTEDSAINVPAVAAAHVIKRYTAQASDEISFEVCFVPFNIMLFMLFLEKMIQTWGIKRV